MAKPGRPGAGKPKKKGPTVGTGGHGRQKLEGKGPTPKATDRSWHVAGKRKAAKERLDEARERHGGSSASRGGRTRGRGGLRAAADGEWLRANGRTQIFSRNIITVVNTVPPIWTTMCGA